MTDNLNPVDMDHAELIKLANLALKFKNQQVGKRPEFIQRYITDIVKEMADPTFKNLLYELEVAAVRRDRDGEKASPIEKIDRVWQLITYWDHKNKRIQITFDTLRNKLTVAKRNKFTITS